MKRIRLLGSLLAAAMALSLTACGDEANEPIEFWNPLVGDDGRYMQNMVDAYNATSPAIPVSFQPSPAADMYTRMYSVARAGRDIPDLVIVHGPRIAELARNDILTPLDPLLEHQPNLNAENYLEAAWDAGQVDGHTWAVPLDLHGVITYYNEDLLDRYDAWHILDDELITVDELLELEGRLDDDVYAMAGLFKPGLVTSWQYNQGRPVGRDGEPVDLTGPTFVRAFEALVALNDAGLLEPEDSDSLQTFRSGRAVFFPDGTWGASGHADIDGLNFGLAHTVQLETDTPTNYLESHVFAQMNDEGRDPERDQAVADFLEFIRTNSIEWAEAGQIVASREVYESAEYLNYPQSYFTLPENEEMLMTDNYEYASLVSFWGIADDIVYGRYSIDQGLQRMTSEVNARIELLEGP